MLSEGGATPRAGDEVMQLDLGAIVRSPYQPRSTFSEAELAQLSESIRASGVLQPILVRRVGTQYELVAGERRWRAARAVGLERIPALVLDISDQMAAVYGLVENLQRADLNAIEKARAFAKIQALTKGTQEDVARQVGLDRSTVANFQRLLGLPEPVQQLVSRGTLSMGHARALLALSSAEEQTKVADEAVRRAWSVRQTEAFVQELSATLAPAAPKSPGSRRGAEPWVREIEETLSEALATPVTVRYSKKRSRITIECLGRAEFERVYDLLKSKNAAS